jgi:predicted amidohydrolase
MAYVVAANQGAQGDRYPPFTWPGGSMVVDYDGRILSQADPGPGERIVVAPIDLAALRAERERRRGHHVLSHLRTETYTAYRQSIYPRGSANRSPMTFEKNENAIDTAKRRLRSR